MPELIVRRLRWLLSLRGRVIVLTMLASLPLLVYASWAAWEFRSALLREHKTAALTVARLAAGEISQMIANTRQLLSVLSASLPRDEPLEGLCSSQFRELVSRFAVYHQAAVIDPSGNVVCALRTAAERANVSDREYFQRVLRTGDFAMSGVVVSRTTRRQVLVAAHPLKDAASSVRGVLVISIDLQWINAFFQRLQMPPGNVLALVDEHGAIAARYPPIPGVIGERVPDLPEFMRLAKHSAHGFVEGRGFDDLERITAFAHVGGDHGVTAYVRVGFMKDAADQYAADILTRGVITFVVVLVLATLFAWHGSRAFVVAPVRRLIDAAGRLAQGDLTARSGVTKDGTELGELARVFDEMARGIEDREHKVHFLAYSDPLTGLANRGALLERVGQAIAAANAAQGNAALLKLDLERFNEIDEALGYEFAKHVLKACAARLVARSGPRASVARIGEASFAILLPHGGVDDAASLVPALMEALHEPFEHDGARVYVTATTGIAIFPKHGSDAEALLRRAAIAATDAKRTRSAYSMHDGEPERESARRVMLAGDLRRALGGEGLTLMAQPKLDLHTGRVCGAELLARWNHPTLGAISPAEFVPLAEHTGLIKPLTYWVLAAAAQAAHTLSRKGLPIPLAANISTRNLYDPEFVQKLASLCNACALPPNRIELEITETALMEDPDVALRVLCELRTRGHALHLDDFGSGYSSLAYLQRLPVNCVKIDRVFIKDVKSDRKAQSIVRFATELAHGLDMRVVAEGVEDLATLDEVTALGCDMAQGYHLSRPVAIDDLPQTVARLHLEQGAR